MKKTYITLTPIALVATMMMSQAYAQTTQFNPVTIVGAKDAPQFGVQLSGESLNSRGFANGDTASLLDGVPGVSLYTGGGVSSLPVINGLADDRLKITVDGMSITSACPNHMNPALSYIDPAAIGQINVFAGIVPVSQGGDSIGGAIAVKSAPPVFAAPGEGLKTDTTVSAYHRSNGSTNGLSLRTSLATENFSIAYVGNTIDAKSYKDGLGREVIASRYKVRNNALNLASKSGSDVFTLDIGWQEIPFQGYPNQAMDMTSNKSLSFNAGYKGLFAWGDVEARAFRQRVRHKMDILPEKTGAMPMDTKAVDLGYSIIATVPLSEKQVVKYGHEFHRYTLDDWWPPLAGYDGMMGPNTFWNIYGGKRDRLALFGELDSKVTEKLSTQFGARVEQVIMNTGNVQGYFSTADDLSYDNLVYKANADAFNAKNHKKKDINVDLTASARYIESARETYDIGFSRKTRSPNLHERYTWSHEFAMAGLMNNWFGDLNSYVGDINLKPETAYTLKANGDWHDADRQDWQIKLAPFYTYISNYINVIDASPTAAGGWRSMVPGGANLQFANQNAYIYGFDISGKKYLGKANGDWTSRAAISYVRGKTTSGDNLYNIMPLNARLAVDYVAGPVSNTLEGVFVSSKDDVSAIRNERRVGGYSLFNYKASYALTKSTRLNAGVDNIFDKQYGLPLGGIEYAGINQYKPTRAPGRSVNVGFVTNF